jgi:hypothetical protein
MHHQIHAVQHVARAVIGVNAASFYKSLRHTSQRKDAKDAKKENEENSVKSSRWSAKIPPMIVESLVIFLFTFIHFSLALLCDLCVLCAFALG